MNWVYFFHRYNKALDIHPVLELYLRPYIQNEKNEQLVGEKVVSLSIMAMDKLFEIKEAYNGNYTNDEWAVAKNNFYARKLGGKEYSIESLPMSEADKEIYQSKIMVYLACKGFTINEAWEWIRKVFVIFGYPYDSFKEGTYNDFIDTNEVMQIFSEKNAKKFEKLFGDRFWEKGDK